MKMLIFPLVLLGLVLLPGAMVTRIGSSAFFCALVTSHLMATPGQASSLINISSAA